MCKMTRRGFVLGDEIQFSGEQIVKLNKAVKNMSYLVEEGYPIKSVSTFVGNHYLLSERQRLALTRMVASFASVRNRNQKLLHGVNGDVEVNMDGFNTLITLEVALSHSLVLRCMDGTIRDLAGLRGTYHIIDKTQIAIHRIFEWLEAKKIKKATIYLDAPVSNSGRLKVLFYQISEEYQIEVLVEVIHDVDRVLEQKEYVITSDAIILDRCKSWLNMNAEILESLGPDSWVLELKL